MICVSYMYTIIFVNFNEKVRGLLANRIEGMQIVQVAVMLSALLNVDSILFHQHLPKVKICQVKCAVSILISYLHYISFLQF